MLLIYITLIAMLAMAKKPKRKFRKYLRGQVDEDLSLGTLAARTMISAIFGNTVNERTFVSSVKASWSLTDYTIGGNIGPILVGIAHSDYSTAEVEAFIENTGSWNEGDQISQEIGRRKIRIVGTFMTDLTDRAAAFVLNDGKPITTKCGWILLQGQSLRLWAFNLGSAAVATTDPNVHLEGHANLWPR